VVAETLRKKTKNHTILAIFAGTVYHISATAGQHGSISPSGELVASPGGSQTFTITAEAGYHVFDVVVDSISRGPLAQYTFANIQSNHSIEAIFGINVYTIVALAGPHGGISPVGTLLQQTGSNRTFSIVPNVGYQIDSVLVDSVSQGAISHYTFSDIQSNHTIYATFKINMYAITASAGAHGTITPSGVVYVDYGSEQTFYIVPDSGASIFAVFVDGTNIGARTNYSFVDVVSSHTISASFQVPQTRGH